MKSAALRMPVSLLPSMIFMAEKKVQSK